MKAHWHVIENTPGYLPDSDPATFASLEDAMNYAADLAEELKEDGYQVDDEGDGNYYAERDARDLGRVIETMECDESECLNEEEEQG